MHPGEVWAAAIVLPVKPAQKTLRLIAIDPAVGVDRSSQDIFKRISHAFCGIEWPLIRSSAASPQNRWTVFHDALDMRLYVTHEFKAKGANHAAQRPFCLGNSSPSRPTLTPLMRQTHVKSLSRQILFNDFDVPNTVATQSAQWSFHSAPKWPLATAICISQFVDDLQLVYGLFQRGGEVH